jgi:hypothetical protein
MNQILEGVAQGTLTPSEGDAFAKLIESAAKISELAVLEERVRRLEEASGQ